MFSHVGKWVGKIFQSSPYDRRLLGLGHKSSGKREVHMNLFLSLTVILVFSLGARAEDGREFVARLGCEPTGFRAGDGTAEENSALLWLDVVRKNGELHLESYGGHIYAYGYYGLFHGKDLKEVPYVRATTYKNHYRFKDFDAVFTGGLESGMWGYLVINKSVDQFRAGGVKTLDAHYVFQAGDHMGGTIDFSCKNALDLW
jgi:hypothetical protein